MPSTIGNMNRDSRSAVPNWELDSHWQNASSDIARRTAYLVVESAEEPASNLVPSASVMIFELMRLLDAATSVVEQIHSYLPKPEHEVKELGEEAK